MSDERKKDDDTEDERLEFLLNYLTKSLKLKQEKWNKMITFEDNKKTILKFLNDPKEKILIFSTLTSGLLTPFTSFNNQIKQKFTYLIRTEEKAVSIENLRDVVTFGDMSGKPIDDLSVLLEGIFVPLMSNPNNHVGWPKVVAKDVVSHLREFKSTLNQVKGAMKNKVILSMPQGISTIFQATQAFVESNGAEVNLQLKTLLENTVTEWSTICQEVLKQTSQICFSNETNPLPSCEIDFWTMRNKNMESIYDQLCDPRVKKMAEYLELTKSTYSKTFQKLFKQIVAGLLESRDICQYLKILKQQISNFDSDFFETEPYVKPLYLKNLFRINNMGDHVAYVSHVWTSAIERKVTKKQELLYPAV